MTRKFNVHYTCQHCGHQTTAETGFGRWMRGHQALDSVQGIVRTDTDHIIVRYKTSLDGRDFQLMMVVEVKEYAAAPDPSQIDILSFLRQAMEWRQRNHHQRNNRSRSGFATFKLHSKLLNRRVNVRFFGVYLLQFENTSPDDGWCKWNGKLIDPEILVGVLAMERRPDNPDLMMIDFLRDRHSKHPEQLKFIQ